jgi:prephenate dehydrogenase
VTPRSVLVYGLGLIGGSLGLALRALPDPPRVLGFDVDPDVAREALRRNALDHVVQDPDALEDVDLVVTAVPPRAAIELVPRILSRLPERAFLTDLSSVMLPVLTATTAQAGTAATRRFVGSHPLRGSERSGLEAARPDLYEGGRVIVGGPLDPGTPAERSASMWRSIGATPVPMAPTIHDALVALTSHLPQAASTALVRTLRRTGSLTGQLAQGGGPGLRDMTRLAESPPDLWFDILTLNAEKVTPALVLLEREVRGLRQAIERKDPGLRALLEEARLFRKEIVP